MTNTKTKVYFPGLNGLRFFAAFAVIITHIELIKKYLGFDTLWFDAGRVQSFFYYPLRDILDQKVHWLSPLVAELGPLGVVFFFVLSGFLITYLLLVEKNQTATVSIKKFYLRRVLRIWPLYFLIFILGFFVLPHFDAFYVPEQSESLRENFWGNFWCYLCILPNLGLAIYIVAVPAIGQSWSIGVEQQFYIIWPVIMKWFKKPLVAILSVTIALLVFKACIILLERNIEEMLWGHLHTKWLRVLNKFLAMSKIECMTIGALGAWLIFTKKERILNLIYSKAMLIFAVGGVFILIYFTPRAIQDGIHLLYAFCFLTIILNVSREGRFFFSLENHFFHLLGKISYGIYMYHLIVVTFVVFCFQQVLGRGSELGFIYNLLIYVLSIGGTILISWLSYEFFELRFIKIKTRFSKVISGEEAR